MYYLIIEEARKNDLAHIRHWNNLKAAFEGTRIWIKDLTAAQARSVEVKSIPYKTLLYEKNGKLCLADHQLPYCSIPTVLWTPLQRALPLSLPRFNHNYFGIHEQVPVRLCPSSQEQPAAAMLVSLTELEHYLNTAPAIRVQHLQWTVVNGTQALVLGTPLLPLNGSIFWQQGRFLLPAGYVFELPGISGIFGNKLETGNDQWVVWPTPQTWFLLPNNYLQPLSLSSFRLTRAALKPPVTA